MMNYIWKDGKVKDLNGKYVQSERKLIEMTAGDLKKCYEHCKTMLFNKDAANPGRYIVLEIIADQKNRCGAELFLRFVEQEKNVTRFTLMSTISEFLANNKDAFKNITPVIGHIFSSISDEYEKIPLSYIMDGCLDRLGTFNRKHITRTFILKQGIWLTPAEVKELSEYDENGNLRDKIEVIKERLNIKEIEKLYINSKGLNYTQLRSLLNIKPNRKYMDMTTAQLETLRYNCLFVLEQTVNKHIEQWEKRMDEIEEISKYKNISLK